MGSNHLTFLLDTSKKTKNNHNYANIDSIAKAKDDTPSVTESEDTESQIVKVDDVNVYGNVLSVLKYKIMVEDLKTAIHEKQKGEDFKKEYAVSYIYAHFKRLSVNPKVIRYNFIIIFFSNVCICLLIQKRSATIL